MRRAVIAVSLFLAGVAMAENGARYLVITTDALYNSILPLAQWKQATGVSTHVVKLSQIGSDTLSMKNYIRNAWNNWLVKPEYVLLVGSPTYLPSRYYHVQGGWSYYSDNIYGDMTGDFEAELAVGRFPARSTSQLDLMVAKTLRYVRNPDLTDSLWMRRLTTIVAEGDDSDDTIYWNNMRRAAAQAGSKGFVRCDSLSRLRGHNAYNVYNSVTAGTGIVAYRGTAGGNWYQPFNCDPAQTANGNKLPIICSFTCETVTLAPNESMAGDAWMKAGSLSTLKGAVAFFGNTHSASQAARLRGAICRGFFDGLFIENKYKLGQTALRAKHQFRVEFPSYYSDYRGFNVLGDPELAIWTGTPRLLDVTHPATIEPGAQTIHAVVTSSGLAVPGALVCASMATDTMVYAYGFTDADGEIDIDVAPGDTGRLRLVVTGQNLYPYDMTIPVTYTAVAEPSAPRPIVDGRLKVSPPVFGSSTRLTWSGATEASVTVYDATGHQVRRLPGQPACTWDARDEQGGVVPTGIYLAVAGDARGRTLGTARLVKVR